MKSDAVKRLSRYILANKPYLLGAVLFAALSNILMVTGPFIVGKGVDAIVEKGQVDFKRILNVVIIILVLYLVSAFFQWSLQVITAVLSNRTVERLRKDAFDHILEMPLRFYDQKPHGDIMGRLTNDMENIGEGIYQSVTQFFTGIISIVGSLIFMFVLNPWITLIVIVMTPITFFIASFITRRSSKMFKEQSRVNGELNGYIEEIIGNQKVVKAFNYEERAQKKFEEINGRLYKCGRWAQFYSSLVNPSTRLVNNITYVLLGMTGGIASLAGRLSIGYISSFLTYSTYFSQPINNVTSVTTQIQSAIASAERVFAIMDEEVEKRADFKEIELEKTSGNVRFDDVSFSYVQEKPLIRDFNLSVKEGQRIAIVGPTGSGKTTLVNLLMRFYETDKGYIYIDGNSISKISKDSLRQSFGMVLQETWLFAGTIRENIAYGKPEATDEEVKNAAVSANAHSFIKRLPKGYETELTEGGSNLSQGQRQLLTIARVMLVIPPMLILDEATSSVDTRTELNIQKAFLKMMEGRTSFVIAHRLSTIKEADVILVMNNGRVVEQGSHEDLLQKNGFYKKLYLSQYENT
ncbi:ABC transporter transmembrane region [Ruminiclostridium papyrosolvens DSM 2782]|uniref:ABC transporter transmembrane region n=1 Tax=Ruminiclostridium papyrosolvens DSM 2782 TaxID=588581 RepID=F1TEK5_9FIRM|nr:ABC transporter ATP-binding protein [Ruminiclostridium papyrosolvens]EGD47171.1 ABC transporter transmembrane region [Ruminiclostridium papyrosolvens DSM 2782]WES36211.1 ABC transporter ATP-binding protein [Ruminiclostridium papyrosolvens DSM 2782]